MNQLPPSPSPTPAPCGANQSGTHLFMGRRFDLIKKAVLDRLDNVSVVQSDAPVRIILNTKWTSDDLALTDSDLADRLATEIASLGVKNLVDIGCSGVAIIDRETGEISYRFWLTHIVIRPQIGVYHDR
jgi:hypothetical protein